MAAAVNMPSRKAAKVISSRRPDAERKIAQERENGSTQQRW
jgi:hypothetical protein